MFVGCCMIDEVMRYFGVDLEIMGLWVKVIKVFVFGIELFVFGCRIIVFYVVFYVGLFQINLS